MPVRDDRPDITRFGHVDAAGDTRSLIAWLDTTRSLPEYPAAKRAVLDQLRLGEARSALDVGCGPGADVIAMAQRLPRGGRAVGIDISDVMLAEARRRASGHDLAVSFDTGDAADLPYSDASLDACRVETVLQHVPDPGRVIGEMTRVTRPGGRIAALEFDLGTMMADHDDRDTTRAIMATFADATAHGWIGRQLPRLFRQAGLTEVSVRPFVVLGGLAVLRALLGSHVDRLCADNVLTATQAGQWWGALEQRAADGDVLGGSVIFVAAATRPG